MIIHYLIMSMLFIPKLVGMLDYTLDEKSFYENPESRKFLELEDIKSKNFAIPGYNYTPEELAALQSACYSALVFFYLRQRTMQYLKIPKEYGKFSTTYMSETVTKLPSSLFNTQDKRDNFEIQLHRYGLAIRKMLDPLTSNYIFNCLVNRVSIKRNSIQEFFFNDPEDCNNYNQYLEYIGQFVHIKSSCNNKAADKIAEELKQLSSELARFKETLSNNKKSALNRFTTLVNTIDIQDAIIDTTSNIETEEFDQFYSSVIENAKKLCDIS